MNTSELVRQNIRHVRMGVMEGEALQLNISRGKLFRNYEPKRFHKYGNETTILSQL